MRSVSLLRLTIIVVGILAMPVALPTIDFQSHMSSVQLQPTNAQLKIVNNQQIIGWSDRSIIKTFGHNAASAWPEAYANGTIISQSGGTKVPQTELVQANSSAIISLSVNPLVRTTSNAVLYGLRINSNALLYGDRVTSNAIAGPSALLRTNSNAFAFGNRTTSAAIVYGVGPMPIADSIDGTVVPRYRTKHHVFHNNGNAWSVRGWVRFNDGFTVMPRASVIMDTLVTVSGGFDLRDTGTLILNNDLYLAHNVTLTNGGYIKGKSSMTVGGQANTIFMGGDLTLASTIYARSLRITGDWSNNGTSGDLIIDGCGHTLNIGDRAQIFVDPNVTLTLRNMTITTGPKSAMMPAILLASQGSKLALDNVMFDLGSDFRFNQGNLFIHNDVAVTGTSAFIYQSTMPSYITSGATWSFEQGTTFSVAPATFTDCPYTVNNTYVNSNFIVLADQSSALSLNGCTLKTTYTGLRLTQGMVMFDNRVAVDTMAGVDLASSGTTPLALVSSVNAGSGLCVIFSPDGRFFAAAADSVRIFKFNSAGGQVQIGGALGVPSARYLSFSPDGRFLAAIPDTYPTSALYLYRMTGNSTPILVTQIALPISHPSCVAWSPDGRLLAVVGSSTAIMQIYKFDGVSSLVQVGTDISTGSTPFSVAFSPDGRFLLLSRSAYGGALQMYRVTPSGVVVPFGSAVTPVNPPLGCTWSPDGRFFAVANSIGKTVQVFRFNGSSSPVAVGGAVATGGLARIAAWSPNGRYFVVVNDDATALLRVFKFDGVNAPVAIPGDVIVTTYVEHASWSPDGNYVIAACYGLLQVYRCNFVSTPVAQQSFSNGLSFGDSTKGSSFNANVQVLSGAVATIKGMVRDDSV